MCFLFFMVNSLYLIFFLHSFPFFCNPFFRRHGHVANLFNIVREKKLANVSWVLLTSEYCVD